MEISIIEILGVIFVVLVVIYVIAAIQNKWYDKHYRLNDGDLPYHKSVKRWNALHKKQ